MSRPFLSFAVVVALAVGCRPAAVPAPTVAKTQPIQAVEAPVDTHDPPGTLIADATAEPVVVLKPILMRLAHERPPPRVVQDRPGQWRKRQTASVALTYAVRTTDFIAAPFEATVSFAVVPYVGPECQTKEAAEASALPNEPVPLDRIEMWAKFHWHSGVWVIIDCGHDDILNDRFTYHSDPRTVDSLVEEWWAFFGGRAP